MGGAERFKVESMKVSNFPPSLKVVVSSLAFALKVTIIEQQAEHAVSVTMHF